MVQIENVIKTGFILSAFLMLISCGSDSSSGLVVNGSGVSGTLDSTNPYDLHEFVVESGKTYTIINTGTSYTSLYEYDPVQYQLDNPNSYAIPVDIGSPIEYIAPQSGTVYVFVSTDSTATYDVTVTSP